MRVSWSAVREIWGFSIGPSKVLYHLGEQEGSERLGLPPGMSKKGSPAGALPTLVVKMGKSKSTRYYYRVDNDFLLREA